jgi:hypothetical protein
MKHDCPHCGKQIRWWHYLGARPARGEPKFLPNRAVTVCPLCRGDIEANIHPAEKFLFSFVLTPLGFIMGTALLFTPGPAWLVICGVFLFTLLVGLIYVQVKTKNWQRFRSYEGAS